MEYMTGLALALGANKSIQDLLTLTGLTQLEELQDLADNAIVDLSPFGQSCESKNSATFDNLIIDFSPLKNLVNLEELWLWEIKSVISLHQSTFPD